MFHNSVFSFPKTEGLYFVCLLVNCVLKQEFQLACSTIPEKKERDVSLLLYKYYSTVEFTSVNRYYIQYS